MAGGIAVKLLLDTCAILWLARDPKRLGDAARQRVAARPESLYVSAISAFEIGVKHRKGKLDLDLSPEDWWKLAVQHHGLQVLPVTDTVALASTALPKLHADPCDRIIIATAAGMHADIVTSDYLIAQYPSASVVW
ncbi:MAG: type II toxin-antitoxin system VapC family toxin [Prosthecobacter sp.]|uniref:type II toxin-antitoxin system VapC family toxin n=1 Tax=Prosthecobacter sp. TaxID=1965333 RepID=UPI003900BFF7